MKLIECKNQSQIINALLIRMQHTDKTLSIKDEYTTFFLINELDNNEGMISVTCSDENINIDDIYASDENLKLEAISLLEQYAKKMNFKYFICHSNIESSNFYRDAGFSNFEDLHVEDGKLYVKMVKKL